MKKTSLILHGHFYQPPRENPLTGLIPKQESASPYEDWNEKIYDNCYSANTKSRYLDSNGRILSLTNNYSYISFNFGHTLLSWLEREHPETLGEIVKADGESLKRLGHGNAIAQGYNHTILPLDKTENARLQIIWGIKSFEHYFRRKPEGFWLPECAINGKVIDLLSENGIKFVILSPWQCGAVEDENGQIINLDGRPAPYGKSYILEGETGGKISAFFYHPGLASDISFGHLLRSADALYEDLNRIRKEDKPDLIHTATDGEIYGHHEPYGDMALSALIQKVNERDDFVFDNYPSFLEKHPSELRAFLLEGEDRKGTSWSCSHGVSRWYKNCGCHTGGEPGWNQEWRTPLRDALNNLSDKLEAIFSSEVKRIFSEKLSAQELLIMASPAFSGELSFYSFVKHLHESYSFYEKEDINLSKMLDGIKNKHFSFTSCGWFFSDISGLEPRQDIKYALYAISIFQEYTTADLLLPFLQDIGNAKSNIREMGDGMSISKEELKRIDGEIEASVFFVLNHILASEKDYTDTYGYFKLLGLDKEETGKFAIRVKNNLTDESFAFNVLSENGERNNIDFFLSDKKAPDRKYQIKSSDIPSRIVDDSLKWIDRKINSSHLDLIIPLSKSMNEFASLVKKDKSGAMNSAVVENLGLSIWLLKSIFSDSTTMEKDQRKASIGSIIEFIKKYGRESDITLMQNIICAYLKELAGKIMKNGVKNEDLEEILFTLSLSRSHGLEPESKSLQDVMYMYYLEKTSKDISPDLLRETLRALNFE